MWFAPENIEQEIKLVSLSLRKWIIHNLHVYIFLSKFAVEIAKLLELSKQVGVLRSITQIQGLLRDNIIELVIPMAETSDNNAPAHPQTTWAHRSLESRQCSCWQAHWCPHCRLHWQCLLRWCSLHSPRQPAYRIHTWAWHPSADPAPIPSTTTAKRKREREGTVRRDKWGVMHRLRTYQLVQISQISFWRGQHALHHELVLILLLLIVHKGLQTN